MNCNGATRRYECPEGDTFVTISFIPNGGDAPKLWLDVNVGHTGEENMASAHALAAMTGQAIRHGMPMTKVVKTLRGVSQEGANHLMANHSTDVALSVSDALGRALYDAFLDPEAVLALP